MTEQTQQPQEMQPSTTATIEAIARRQEARKAVALLTALQNDMAKRRKFMSVYGSLLSPLFLFSLILLVAYCGLPPLVIFLFAPVFFILGNFINGRGIKPRILQALATLEDKRCIGPLLEIYCEGVLYNEQTRYTAKTTLIRLLPRMTTGDGELLTPQQWGLLDRALQQDDPVFARAILKALEQIGEENEIPYVERLAEQGNWELSVLAQQCLRSLRERAEQHQARQTLLRASAAVTPPEVLLRPATGTTTTEPEQLLRASDSQE